MHQTELEILLKAEFARTTGQHALDMPFPQRIYGIEVVDENVIPGIENPFPDQGGESEDPWCAAIIPDEGRPAAQHGYDKLLYRRITDQKRGTQVAYWLSARSSDVPEATPEGVERFLLDSTAKYMETICVAQRDFRAVLFHIEHKQGESKIAAQTQVNLPPKSKMLATERYRTPYSTDLMVETVALITKDLQSSS